MAVADYHFVTRWSFEATAAEISDILSDIDSLSRWWPTVYLEVKTVAPGDERGIGRRVDLLTKGRLPYRLRWQFTVVESNPPHGFTIEAVGDFVGRGVWTLTESAGRTDVEFDWRIRAEKPLLKRMTFALRPVFSWNHDWAMKQGERSLRAEIARRRGAALSQPG